MSLNKNKFIKYLKNNYSFEKNPFIAVSVSGGPDSMCLLFLLNYWIRVVDGTLIALIVNHNLREDSLIEAQQINKYLNKINIKSKILSVNKKLLNKRSMAEARNNRYNLITNYCNKHNIIHLFVGHHKNDNLETFLNRKVSGSDFDGLGSIKNISLLNNIVLYRPLLNFSKNDILKYNNKNNIPYVSDPSNNNFKYTRPSIREFIINTTSINQNKIEDDFETINKYLSFYKLMISEIMIKNIVRLKKNYIELNVTYFIQLDKLLSEKIVKEIYKFFYFQKTFLRSKKIQIFLYAIENDNFRIYNLKGMIIKKINNSLVFLKKAN